MKSVTVVYIHVPHDAPHEALAKLYVDSVRQFPGGHPHRNLIVSQGEMPTPEMQALFGRLENCSYYVHDDTGWDIGGFIAAAGQVRDEVMLCLGSSAQVRRAGWLARMMAAWDRHGPGLYGSLASFQVRPHLNTTGFWCSPQLLMGYPKRVLTKDDRYEFEHGVGAFWRRVHVAGGKVMLVTWCGEYPWKQWRTPPNISCRGNQENCLTYFRINYEYDRCCRNNLPGRLAYESLCDTLTEGGEPVLPAETATDETAAAAPAGAHAGVNAGAPRLAAFSPEPIDAATARTRLGVTTTTFTGGDRPGLRWTTSGEPDARIEESLDHDVFVLQGNLVARLAEPVVAAARAMNRPVVYDLAEASFDLMKSDPRYQKGSPMAPAVYAMLREADFVVANTTKLKESIEAAVPPAAGKVHVVPDHIDVADWAGAGFPAEDPSGRLVIGFTGYAHFEEDVEMVRPVIAELGRKYPGRLTVKFFGAVPKTWDGLAGVVSAGEPQQEARLYARQLIEARLDVALVPMADSPYNQARSDVSWLEHACAGVPGIYSNLGAFARSVDHGRTGLLVENSPAAWLQAIETLLRDRAMRQRIATAAGDEVRRTRGTEAGAKAWESLGRMIRARGPRRTTVPVQMVTSAGDRAAAHLMLFQARSHVAKGQGDYAAQLCDQALYRFMAQDPQLSFARSALEHYRETINELQVNVQVRAQLAAARAVAEAGVEDRAVQLYLDTVVAQKDCSNPVIVLRTLLEVSRAFLRLDRDRGQKLLEIAQELAGNLRLGDGLQAVANLKAAYRQPVPLRKGAARVSRKGETANVPAVADVAPALVQVPAVDQFGSAGTTAPEPVALTSIIVLVLNQLDHTRQCVDSLFADNSAPFELIMVDNGSTDGTGAYLQELQRKHPGVRVITNRSNRGFAAGNNQGLTLARGDAVVLLNNDTIVTRGWLARMRAVLQRHPEAGVVGPMSNRVSGPQLVSPVAYGTPAELPAFAEKWAADHAGEVFEVARAVGFCLLVRREVVDRIGGLDECFGSGNFEDDDYCIRARLAGYRVVVARDVFIHHTGSQTFQGAKIDYRAAMLRNWDLFRNKWRLPADVDLAKGYPVPQSLPAGLPLTVALPELSASHQSAANGALWTERGGGMNPSKPAAVARKMVLPAVALLAQVTEAQDLLRRKSPRAAWESACAAITVRPHHPEAFLVLAEVARMVGDGKTARRCANHAVRLAPEFKPARKFLKGGFQGETRPAWLVPPPQVAVGAEKGRERLSVCLIVKNEERFLGQCLASVKGLADQIVVVDTGSTDRTVAIAREHGAEVYPFTWCDDFSAARNAALQHATGDWVLSLDADEELPPENHPALRRLLAQEDVMGWRLPLFDVGREESGHSYVPRLFRNAPGLFWIGRVHEQIFYSVEARRREWGLESRIGDAALRHHGYAPEILRERGKVERNLRLLEQAVLEIPDDPALLINYGLELIRSGRPAEGLRQYQAAFDMMSAQPAAGVVPEAREALLTQFCTHLLAAKRAAEVPGILASPLARGAELTASEQYLLGVAFMETGKYLEAAAAMRACLAVRDRPALTPVHPEVRGVTPRYCLALCLWQAKQVQAAEGEFQAALAEAPGAAKVALDYAQFLQEQEKTVEALQHLNQFAAANPTVVAAWLAGGRIALSRPELLDVAVNWTTVAQSHHPEDAGVCAQRAEALLLAGQPAEALEFWPRQATGTTARVRAAGLLCAVATGAAVTLAPGADTAEVSREFNAWYWRLVEFGAEAVVLRLHDNAVALEAVLPETGAMVRSVMAKLAVAGAA